MVEKVYVTYNEVYDFQPRAYDREDTVIQIAKASIHRLIYMVYIRSTSCARHTQNTFLPPSSLTS